MNLTNANTTDQALIDGFRAATVVGLGITGYSVVRYLRARGLSVTVVDSRKAPALSVNLAEHYPEVDVHFGSLECAEIEQAELLVVSPGLSLREPALLAAKRNGAQIIGDIGLFLQNNTAPVIAITGSNGKSTVTTLVGDMCVAGGLKPLVAGNIGKPVLDALTDKENYDVAVLELSSFQLETTRLASVQSATILNISADHMDRYDSMGDYVLAKARILRGAERAILPRHEAHLEQITNVSEQLTFGLDAPVNEQDYGVVREKSGRWLSKGSHKLMLLRDVPLVGLHNVSNVLSAFALVDFLALPHDALVRAVKSFQGLPHRMQTVAVKQGVTWINDSKATNVGATSTALQSIEGRVIWLAGGEGKGADFADLKKALNAQVALAILFGVDANRIKAAIDSQVAVEVVETLSEAVALASQVAQLDDIVLLSPACASFDMFKSFEHRGQVFSELVDALGTQPGQVSE